MNENTLVQQTYKVYNTNIMAKKLNATEARAQFAEIVNRVAYGGERVVLHRHKKPVAAVVPFDDLRLIEEMEDRLDAELARKAMKERGRNIPLAEVKKKLGL